MNEEVRDRSLIEDVEPGYAQAIGAAVFAFALLEAEALRGCEILQPGILGELDDRTAGRVADTLLSLCRTKAGKADDLIEAAKRFQALVRSRNNLLHAKPGRIGDGAPRLLRDGDAWSEGEMKAIAATFADCAASLTEALARSELLPPIR